MSVPRLIEDCSRLCAPLSIFGFRTIAVPPSRSVVRRPRIHCRASVPPGRIYGQANPFMKGTDILSRYAIAQDVQIRGRKDELMDRMKDLAVLRLLVAAHQHPDRTDQGPKSACIREGDDSRSRRLDACRQTQPTIEPGLDVYAGGNGAGLVSGTRE